MELEKNNRIITYKSRQSKKGTSMSIPNMYRFVEERKYW